VRTKLLPGLLFFAISLGLGYSGLHRFDPRRVEGLGDTQRYVRMVDGTSAWTDQQDLRVLIPMIARPISGLAKGRIGTWNADFLALLIVNSFFVAWSGLLLFSIGRRVTGDPETALAGALLYLLTFNIANVALAGLVDSAEAWAMLAITWALFAEKWRWIPLIGILGALGKETTIPMLFVFSLAWAWCLMRSGRRAGSLYVIAVLMLACQLATVVAVKAVLTGEVVPPWELANATRKFAGFANAFSGALFNHELLYAFGWLLPFGIFRLRKLPSIWRLSTLATLGIVIALSVWWGVGGNVARPIFNVIGPMLALSTAMLMMELIRRERAPAQTSFLSGQ
jgi:hypothetical protein